MLQHMTGLLSVRPVWLPPICQAHFSKVVDWHVHRAILFGCGCSMFTRPDKPFSMDPATEPEQCNGCAASSMIRLSALPLIRQLASSLSLPWQVHSEPSFKLAVTPLLHGMPYCSSSLSSIGSYCHIAIRLLKRTRHLHRAPAVGRQVNGGFEAWAVNLLLQLWSDVNRAENSCVTRSPVGTACNCMSILAKVMQYMPDFFASHNCG